MSDPQNRRNTAANGGPLHQTRELLGAYPFASATPSTHVARHLSNLSISASPPSYVQPPYYSVPPNYGNASAYQAELSQLSTMHVPHSGSDRAYWDASRSDVFQLMSDQSTTNYYPVPVSHWNAASHPSSYQPPLFAQSVMQHTVPYNAYPTPPPAPVTFSSSSSSLANALGSPKGSKIKRVQQQESEGLKGGQTESSRFFDNFLAERVKELPKTNRLAVSGSDALPSTPKHEPSSPDPLQLGGLSSSAFTPLSTPQNSPKKRKLVEVLIETPSKRPSSCASSKGALYSSSNTTWKVVSPSTANTGAAVTLSREPKMQVYVEITPSKNCSTPSRPWEGKSAQSSEDTLSSPHRNEAVVGVRSTGKRTGDRDERVPLEKFLNLVDDVFEAEDNVSHETDISTLPTMFFSKLSPDPTRPLLHPMVIARLSKAVSKVARPTKRTRLAPAHWEGSDPRSPRKAGGMAEVEVQILARLLKLLERSVRADEDLDPFASPASASSWQKADLVERGDLSAIAGKSGSFTKNLSMIESPKERSASCDDDARNAQELGAFVGLPDEQLYNVERLLETARDGILAADCCILLLTSDKLAKQLLSEELISSCLAAIKNSLTRIIYPFVEAPTSDARTFPPFLLHLTKRSPDSSQMYDFTNHRRLIGDIFQTLNAVFSHINNLVCADGLSMTETIIIPAVYIAIGPFFVAEGGTDGDSKAKKDGASSIITSTLGSSGMRGLRLEALSLIRSIFSYHEDQRSWIIEEILSSLVRLSDSKQKAGLFRLRDGRSIRTVSALLLQLVQTSAHGVRVGASRLAKSHQQQLALKRQDSLATGAQEAWLDQMNFEEASLYASGLDAPTKAAKAIVVFLTQRSGKGKSTKNSNELEYRTIFDNLISDLLVVLFRPEWPAASLVLSIICKYMISSLDDVKMSGNDSNASRAMALDHLGVIAGRLRANALKWVKMSSEGKSTTTIVILKSLDEVVTAADKQGLDKLISIHQEVSAHLSKRSAEDHAYESARELNAVIWAQELATTLTQINEVLSNTRENPGREVKENYLAMGSRIKSALRDLWRDAPTDIFDNTTQDEIVRADSSSEQLGTTQALANAFDPILNVIVLALDAPPVFVRTKALRSLSQILTVDPTVLSNPNVRHAIESHLLDNSPQVRDAAVELIGKYMVELPKVAEGYYQKIAERIADTGLGVRKRVIKLFRTFFLITDDFDHKVDICSRLVLRMFDEDDTVKESAVRALEELWFSAAIVGQTGRSATLMIVSVVMGVCACFKDRQAPLEDILRNIISGKEGADVTAIRNRFAEIYDTMIEGLIDASDFTHFTVVNCIRTIHLFTVAFPSVMSGSKASVLLPYLKNSASNEDILASDYILKIYRTSIPHMSKTSINFGKELQSLLQPMVLKPNVHGASLQETVACLCSVVQHITHESARLVALLKSCIARVRQFVSRTDTSLSPNDARALHLLVFIVSLLGEHFDFERLRLEAVDLSAQLDTISKGPIVEYIYTCLLQLYDKFTDGNTRGRILVCLGFLFRARPTLMTLESSATMMDAIFASSEEDNRGRLLKIMQEFLTSESAKHSIQQKVSSTSNLANSSAGVNMEELVGNTNGFAESGVSSAVVQRYLNQILDAALSPVPHVQTSAVDILSFTVKQGLAHPLLSFPVIVALETSSVSSLSSRAVALHTILHHKHASLLNSGFISACRSSFDYQVKLLGSGRGQSEIRGYRMQPMPTALLGRWYALVREKRATRQEFLRAVLKVFELRDVNKTEDDTVHFVRYMAENFASFEYRTQEEVLTVLKTLTRELAGTGALLVERVAPGNMLDQLRRIQNQDPKVEDDHGKTQVSTSPAKKDNKVIELSSMHLEEQLAVMRSTCVIGMIMLLKAYLKNIYGLSEEKSQKFVIGKKSAVGDRPATRRKEVAICWERMPFAMKTVRSAEDIELQRTVFLEVWNEDGATAEPEGDEWE